MQRSGSLPPGQFVDNMPEFVPREILAAVKSNEMPKLIPIRVDIQMHEV